jgi:hypothetical protein
MAGASLMVDHLDRVLDSLDLEADIEDIKLDRATLHQIALMRRAIRREGNRIMASVEELQASADAALAAQADTQAQIAQVAAQVAALQTQTGGIAPADLDPILASLNSITAGETAEGAAVDAIVEPDAGETPPTP